MFFLTFLTLAQHAFENLEESAKDGIVEELLNQGPVVFGEVAKNQWGSYCIQHSTYTPVFTPRTYHSLTPFSP